MRFHSALLGFHEKFLSGYLKELLNPGTSPRVPSEISSRVSSGNQKDAPFYIPPGVSPKILSQFSTFDFRLLILVYESSCGRGHDFFSYRHRRGCSTNNGYLLSSHRYTDRHHISGNPSVGALHAVCGSKLSRLASVSEGFS